MAADGRGSGRAAPVPPMKPESLRLSALLDESSIMDMSRHQGLVGNSSLFDE